MRNEHISPLLKDHELLASKGLFYSPLYLWSLAYSSCPVSISQKGSLPSLPQSHWVKVKAPGGNLRKDLEPSEPCREAMACMLDGELPVTGGKQIQAAWQRHLREESSIRWAVSHLESVYQENWTASIFCSSFYLQCLAQLMAHKIPRILLASIQIPFHASCGSADLTLPSLSKPISSHSPLPFSLPGFLSFPTSGPLLMLYSLPEMPFLQILVQPAFKSQDRCCNPFSRKLSLTA